MAKAIKTKAPVKKKAEKVETIEVEAIEPEVGGEIEETEFDSAVKVRAEGEEATYTVKLDSKKLEGRTEDQVTCLVAGAIGSVKKIIVEQE